MEYKVETSLWDFPAWSGGKDTLDVLKERGDCDEVESLIVECFDDPTDTDINDFLWFDTDTIAEHLGYKDWDAYVSGEDEDEEDEDESNLDYYGEKIEIGSKVHWDDEAGLDDDDNEIEFTVVDSRGDGYFNLSYGEDDKNPDRWAFRTELEVI